VTSALVVHKWSASSPGHFNPGEGTPVPVGQEAVLVPEPVWVTWRKENSCPYRGSNSDPSVIQSLASIYTNSAILAIESLTMLYTLEAFRIPL
jgi:hypothetical protein